MPNYVKNIIIFPPEQIINWLFFTSKRDKLMYEDSVLPVLLPKQIGDKGLQNPVQRNQVTYPIRQEVVVLQRN